VGEPESKELGGGEGARDNGGVRGSSLSADLAEDVQEAGGSGTLSKAVELGVGELASEASISVEVDAEQTDDSAYSATVLLYDQIVCNVPPTVPKGGLLLGSEVTCPRCHSPFPLKTCYCPSTNPLNKPLPIGYWPPLTLYQSIHSFFFCR